MIYISIVLILLVSVICIGLTLFILKEYKINQKNKKIFNDEIEKEKKAAMNNSNVIVEENNTFKKFINTDLSFQELQELQNDVTLIEKKLLSNTEEEIEVDYVTASQILKNWDSKVLVSEDGKLIMTGMKQNEVKGKKFNPNINFENINRSYVDIEKLEAKDIVTPKENITFEDDVADVLDIIENVSDIDKQIDDDINKIEKIEKEIIGEKIEEIKDEKDYFNYLISNIITNKTKAKNLINGIIDMENRDTLNIFYYKKNHCELLFNAKVFFTNLYKIKLFSINEELNNKLILEAEILNEEKVEFIVKLNLLIGNDFFKTTKLPKGKVHIAKKLFVIFEDKKESIDFFLNINYLESKIDFREPEFIFNNQGAYSTHVKYKKDENIELIKDEEKPF